MNGTKSGNSLEARVSSVETSVRSLQDDAARILVELGAIRTEITGIGKPNWGLIVGGSALVVTVLLALMAAWIKPLEAQVSLGKEYIHEQGRRMEAGMTDLELRLREIEQRKNN